MSRRDDEIGENRREPQEPPVVGSSSRIEDIYESIMQPRIERYLARPIKVVPKVPPEFANLPMLTTDLCPVSYDFPDDSWISKPQFDSSDTMMPPLLHSLEQPSQCSALVSAPAVQPPYSSSHII